MKFIVFWTEDLPDEEETLRSDRFNLSNNICTYNLT